MGGVWGGEEGTPHRPSYPPKVVNVVRIRWGIKAGGEVLLPIDSAAGGAMALRLLPILLAALLLAPPAAEGIWYHHRAIQHRRGRARVRPRHNHGKFSPGRWSLAHATFYGGSDGSETTGMTTHPA